MPDWTYVPDRGLKKSSQPRIRETRFGDGYTQRSQDGINYMNEAWDLTFNNRTFTDISAMLSFLETKGGGVAFTWTPPGGAEVKVICRDWSVDTIQHTGTNSESYGSLATRFERVYE
jgi:phage-related protein